MSRYTDISQKVISTTDLEIGMFVSKLDRPWEQTPFIFQGFLISNQEEIYQLQQYCREVFIDIKQTIEIQHKPGGTAAVKKKSRYLDTVSFENELPTAVNAYQQTKQQVDTILTSLRMGYDLDAPKIKSLVKDCVKSVIRNSGALSWLTQIRNRDDYTAEHSLRVAIMSIAFGKDLDLLEEELENLGVCGLLHDVGKVRVPLEVLNKEGRLTAEEFQAMRTHPTEGKKLLQSKRDVFAGAVDVAYSHHERVDGKGYPRGITSEKIPYFAKIVAITDAYDAITSNRCYRNGSSSLEALRIIYDDRGLHFDRELAERFVRFIGIYPPGHIAELNTGHIGIILSSQQDHKLRPKVMIVRSTDKQTPMEKVIDLHEVQKLKDGTPLRIKEIHNDGAFGIDLQYYRDKGLRIWQDLPDLDAPKAASHYA